MNRVLKSFLLDERGQDLIEYALLLAFVSISSAALFVTTGGSVSNIWNVADSRLDEAKSRASSPSRSDNHHHHDYRW